MNERAVGLADTKALEPEKTPSLYKKRVKIHPMRVKGTFRRLKWWVMGVTLAVYYVVPWLRWDRGPGAPDQAVLIDFPARRFYFFFIEIWPQEIYYITGLLIMAALGLFLVTAIVGRAWCGYACPQTVWTDLFIVVERFVEGDRNARRRLDGAPWSLEKLGKRAAKYALWLVIALGTGGAWVFYFADAPTMVSQLAAFEAPPIAYVTIGILSATTFVLGGFAREQVCTYMCPWPRIQATMMDEESLIVTYRDWRGEPRGPHRAGDPWTGRGDCVACNRCVAVCPTGIDIRDGQQLECITCALCIDACDEAMRNAGRPRGLIAYDTLTSVQSRAAGLPRKVRLWRPRTIAYGVLLAAVGILMLAVLLTRGDVELNVLHDRNPVYVALSNGDLRNAYTVKVLNKSHRDRQFALAVEGQPGAHLEVVGEAANGERGEAAHLAVEKDRLTGFRVLVTAPPMKGEADIAFVLTDVESGAAVRYGAAFRGPQR